MYNVTESVGIFICIDMRQHTNYKKWARRHTFASGVRYGGNRTFACMILKRKACDFQRKNSAVGGKLILLELVITKAPASPSPWSFSYCLQQKEEIL